MSKDLEREYRVFVNSEVPDLWARIEAGLEDKRMSPEKAETDLHITDFPATDSRKENVCGKKANLKVWAGLAAACACVVLIVPAMAGMMMGGDGVSYSNSQSDAPQAAETYEKAENTGLEEAFEEAAADNDAAADEIGMSGGADAANVDSGALEEEPYIFRVTVEILDTDVSVDGGILYAAKVITSENPDMEADSEIRIFSSEVVLEESKCYDLMLSGGHSGDSGEENRYWLINDAVE